MSISNSSVLVELNISVWTAAKLDKSETQRVVNQNNAASNAAQVRKNLLAGTNKRKDIAEYANACRIWHNSRTLPWADKGQRLLPTSIFFDYKTEAAMRKNTFDRMVEDFLTHYPAIVQTAHNYMGSLFNPDDYPTVDELRDKFGYRMVFSPVPESGDFRLDVGQRDLAEIKEEYEENFKSRLADAMREPWERLHKELSHISERLTDSEVDVEDGSPKRRYHASLITNAQNLCGLLSHLNVTRDPKLEEARQRLEAVMSGADIEVIRESPVHRADVKSKVDEILKKFEW